MSPQLLLAVAAALVPLALAAAPSHAATPKPPATISFTFVGDTILGNTPQLPSEPSRYLTPVTAELTDGSDVVVANLEGTLTSTGQSKCPGGSGGDCFAFRNPPSYARILARAGVDLVTLANNHSYDYGDTGLRSTETALTDAGVRFAGLPGQISYLKRHGVRIAVVAFAPYGRTNNLLDLATAARLIRSAHSQAPIVVVYMHAGAEGAAADHVTGREEHYAGEDRGNPRRFAHLAIDSGASLVVASGPHVLRGLEFYKGRLVAYSLGNFANFHNFSTSGSLSRSLVLHVTLRAGGRFDAASLTSIALGGAGRASVGGDSLGFVRSLSREDFGAHAARITAKGRVLLPAG